MKKFFLMAMAIVAMSVAAQEVNVKPFTVRYIDEDRLYQQYVVAQQYLQLQAKLKNAGYSAQIASNPNGMFRVIATTFDDLNTAVQSRNALRAQYPDAWLLRR